MNRNYYCKVDSQEEADTLLEELKELGEKIETKYLYDPLWTYISFNKEKLTWGLLSRSYIGSNAMLVKSSELISYVKGETPETKFIVGKWYKNLGSPKIYTAKFSFIDSNNIFCTTDAGYIYGRKYELATSEGRITPNYKDAIECSLEEIQDYLPFNHPDKLTKKTEEFVLPDRWHVVVTEENQEILSRWREYLGMLPIDNIVGICNKDGNKGNNPKSSLVGKDYDFGKEITFDQFKKYVLKDQVKSNNKFEVGKWYKDDNWTSNSYAKFLRLEDDRFYFSERIKNWYKKVESWWRIDDKTICKEVSLEEIQQYLPEGHSDKIVKSIKKWSVGTYVVCVTNYGAYSRIGDIDKIDRIVDKDPRLEKEGIFAQEDDWFRWFPTLKEAEEFSKTIKPMTTNKLELNKWYKDKLSYNQLVFRTNKSGGYGFVDDIWSNSLSCQSTREWILADEKEVKERLLKYADNKYSLGKGNTRGTTIKSKFDESGKYSLNDAKIHISREDNDPYGIRGGGACLYSNGNWAEIITIPKTDTTLQFPMITDKDYKVGDVVEITNLGKIYSTFDSVFKEVGFRNTVSNSIENSKTGKIFHICKHSFNSLTLLSLNLDDGAQVLISKDGVKHKESDNYQVGDWVFITGKNAGNGLEYHGKEDGIFQLLEIDISKNPSGNLRSISHFMFKFKENYFLTNKKHILRKATFDEVVKILEPNLKQYGQLLEEKALQILNPVNDLIGLGFTGGPDYSHYTSVPSYDYGVYNIYIDPVEYSIKPSLFTKKEKTKVPSLMSKEKIDVKIIKTKAKQIKL